MLRPTRMRQVLTLLALAAILAGCTRAPAEANEDVRGSYERGLGVAVSVTNEATKTAIVHFRVANADGGDLGSDTATIEPGKTAVRRYAAPDRIQVKATMSYTIDAGGSASGGNDVQNFPLLSCDELTRASWKLVGTPGSFGSQWLGTTCESPG